MGMTCFSAHPPSLLSPAPALVLQVPVSCSHTGRHHQTCLSPTGRLRARGCEMTGQDLPDMYITAHPPHTHIQAPPVKTGWDDLAQSEAGESMPVTPAVQIPQDRGAGACACACACVCIVRDASRRAVVQHINSERWDQRLLRRSLKDMSLGPKQPNCARRWDQADGHFAALR